MKRILIADKDLLTAQSIATILLDLYPSCEIMQASQEAEFLRFALTGDFDLIVYDISEFGFDAIRTIQHYGKPPFILTAQPDNLDFVLDAIYIGIMYFLFKPINPQQFIAYVREIAAGGYAKKSIADSHSKASYINNILQTMSTGLMARLLFSGVEYMPNEADDFEMCFEQADHAMVIMDFADSPHDALAIEKIREALQDAFSIMIYGISSTRIFVLISAPPQENLLHKSESLRIFGELEVQLRDLFPNLKIGIGQHCASILDVRQSAIQAANALYYGTQHHISVVHVDDIDLAANDETSNEMHVSHLLTRIRNGDYIAASIFLSGLSSQLKTTHDFLQFLLNLTLSIHAEWPETKAICVDILARLNSGLPKDEYLNIYGNFLSLVTTRIGANSQVKMKKTIDDFILRNIDQTIRLEDVAAEVNLSPSYFCKRYKSTTGHTFSSRVSELRVAKAKELLMYNDAAIHEIAAQVGYKDACYFSKVFKAQTGSTPSTFRNDK